MSGAIGSIQIKKWEDILKKRIENKDYFMSVFADKGYLTLQKEVGNSSWFSFGVYSMEAWKVNVIC